MWPEIHQMAGLHHRSMSAGIYNIARSSWVQFPAWDRPYCVEIACASVSCGCSRFPHCPTGKKKWIPWSVHVGCSLLLRDQMNAGNESHFVDMVWVICFNFRVGSSCVLLPFHTSPLTCVPTGMFPSCVSVFQICSLWFSGLFYITLDFFSFLSPVCVACPFVTWNIDFGPRSSAFKINFFSFTCILCLTFPEMWLNFWNDTGFNVILRILKTFLWKKVQCFIYVL